MRSLRQTASPHRVCGLQRLCGIFTQQEARASPVLPAAADPRTRAASCQRLVFTVWEESAYYETVLWRVRSPILCAVGRPSPVGTRTGEAAISRGAGAAPSPNPRSVWKPVRVLRGDYARVSDGRSHRRWREPASTRDWQTQPLGLATSAGIPRRISSAVLELQPGQGNSWSLPTCP
jgi:hypothetical protein